MQPFVPGGQAVTLTAANPLACFDGFRFPQDLSHILQTMTVTLEAGHGGRPSATTASDDEVASILSPTRLSAFARLENEPSSWSSLESVMSSVVFGLPRMVSGQLHASEECTAHKCTYEFSPYAQACVRLAEPSRRGATTLTATLDTTRFTLVLLAVGLMIMLLAPLITATRKFYYVFAGALGAALSIGIVMYVIVSRTDRMGTKTKIFAATAMQVLSLSMWSRLTALAADHVGFFIVYVLVFFGAAVALVHQKMPDTGPPPSRVTDIFAVLLEVVGAAVVAYAFSSTKVGLAASVLCLAVAHSVRLGLLSLVYAWLRMPATPQPRRLLTVEQYELLGKATTERALADHVKSPEFVRWMASNWHRVRVDKEYDEDELDDELGNDDDDNNNGDDDGVEYGDDAHWLHHKHHDGMDDEDEEEGVGN